jgi:hypothetical protein
MVLFIKGPNEINIDNLRKMMINIERNKQLYKLNGTKNKPSIANNSFNKYVYKDVEYDISISCGVLLLYCDDFDKIDFMKKLIENFNNNQEVDLAFYPYNYKLSRSTHYTLLLGQSPETLTGNGIHHNKKVYRIITDNRKKLPYAALVNTRFIWHIKHVIRNDKYLRMQELCNNLPTKLYLVKSPSVIIYDSINIFNVKSGVKQLNYPSSSQYNCNILNITIYINDVCGLDYNIISAYMGEDIIDYRLRFNYNNVYDYTTYADCNLIKNEKNKMWYDQIKEPINCGPQENLKNKTDDVCFISQTPLYGKVYILKVGKFDIIQSTYINISYIAIHPFLKHGGLKHIGLSHNGLHFNVYFTKKTGYKIITTFYSHYPRTEIDVINNIPSDKINATKKYIMQRISINGACVHIDGNSKTLITYDKKKLFVGTIGDVYAIDVYKYMGTCANLFKCIYN